MRTPSRGAPADHVLRFRATPSEAAAVEQAARAAGVDLSTYLRSVVFAGGAAPVSDTEAEAAALYRRALALLGRAEGALATNPTDARAIGATAPLLGSLRAILETLARSRTAVSLPFLTRVFEHVRAVLDTHLPPDAADRAAEDFIARVEAERAAALAPGSARALPPGPMP